MKNIKSMGWYLEGALDYQESLVVPIDATPFLVGRDGSCNLTLTSTEISRKHAQILYKRDRLYITDLKSMNGTFINRCTVSELTEIHKGDLLRFGKVEFRVNRRLELDINAPNTLVAKTSEHQETGKFVDFTQEMEFLAMLNKAEVETHFQPIVTLLGGHTVAYEVLGRGAHEGLPTDPRQLLGIGRKLRKEIELSGLFRPKGLQLGAVLPPSDIFFLNTHPAEKIDVEFDISLRRLRAIAPKRPIALEIHESAITNLQDMKKLRKVLQEYAIYLAYDDFGVGQARINELAEVPPDFLKFDLSLIRDIDKASANKQKLVNKLVDMASNLGIATIAECIETAEEVEVCKQMGFSHAQGYYFGKPAPAAHYTDTKAN